MSRSTSGRAPSHPVSGAPERVLFIQGGGQHAHAEDARLVDSLRGAPGANRDVRYPRMPDEGDPQVAPWRAKILSELSRSGDGTAVVAHSIGGAIVLRVLSEERIDTRIDGLFLLAAPAWDGERWNVDDLKLRDDVAERLAFIAHIEFHHCRDDAVVPFAHLALHARCFPDAATQAHAHGGHAFGDDLRFLAARIAGRASTA